MRLAITCLAALALAGPAGASNADAVDYLLTRQQSSGGFAEPGRSADPALTAWAVLGLRAAGRSVPDAAGYLAGKPYPAATDLELRILALAALGRDVDGLARQLEGLRRSTGAIGPTLNSTIWGVLALEAAGRVAGSRTVAYIREHQRRGGGFPWEAGGAADSNDTAAAIQALRAAGVPASAKAIRRAVAYLRRLQNDDGGFEMSAGRGSDVQSTAWAIQGLLAARQEPGRAAFAYLERMQRPDGSFRYSSRYATTPVWVTSQALAALSRRPFPL
ncbi:MAG: terpene cyclase/mutase family protein [Thermoleophilia bacterium]|nr:terpene cyclase/mutase family protein [Thermoleophilia bacterium]